MSESSIAALALEESLRRRWSDFHRQVEEQRTAPATREHAERFREYARNDAFVDSVVDALSLFLADRSDFDRKLGGHLELMLIQRGQADDVSVLEKLAGKYIAAGDLNGVIGLRHRLQLYACDPRFHHVAKLCTDALGRVQDVRNMTEWARSIGVEPQADSWTCSLKLGSAPPRLWFIGKHDLRPRDVSLDLLINESQWRVQVARVDRNYSAQWRASGITVDTSVTRLKALTAWPKLATPVVFPLFAIELGGFLSVEWQRCAWVSSSDASVDSKRLLEWLHPIIEEVQP